MARRALLAGLAASTAITAAACESIPSITFTPDNTGALDAAAPPPGDASSPPPTTDASHVDVRDQSAPDASDGATPVNGTCPQAPPSGATSCCGDVACKGPSFKCQGSCTSCTDVCNSGQTCCFDNTGNFTGCTGTPSECPNR